MSDLDFTTTTRLIWTRTTTSLTTTTTIPVSCDNGVFDVGEGEVDCGGVCIDCDVLNVSSGYIRFRSETYWFHLVGGIKVRSVCGGIKTDSHGRSVETNYPCDKTAYNISMQNDRGLFCYRILEVGQVGRLDRLKFRLLRNTTDGVDLSVKVDPEIRLLPAGYEVFSVKSVCSPEESGVCNREWGGYRFRLMERGSGNTTKFDVTLPSGLVRKGVWLKKGEIVEVDGVSVGLLHPSDQGGFVVLYVKKK